MDDECWIIMEACSSFLVCPLQVNNCLGFVKILMFRLFDAPRNEQKHKIWELGRDTRESEGITLYEASALFLVGYLRVSDYHWIMQIMQILMFCGYG